MKMEVLSHIKWVVPTIQEEEIWLVTILPSQIILPIFLALLEQDVVQHRFIPSRKDFSYKISSLKIENKKSLIGAKKERKSLQIRI